MPFSATEKQHLLATKFVGETLIARLEQMGIHSLAQLAETAPETILNSGTEITGTSCWKNSPQARQAVANAIATAKNHIKP